MNLFDRRLGAVTLALAISFVTLSVTSTARANDPATAQALFDQARKLMTQERWSEACPKLEESQRLDPGGGTLLHLALCREHEGKTATAWAHYQDALSAAKRDGRKDRAKIAQARIDALGPRLHRMRIRVASQNRKLSGFRVTRDEANVGEAQWNESFPVDPGAHTITALADGSKPWTSKVDIPSTAGETPVEVPTLEPDPNARQAATVLTPPSKPTTTSTTTKIEEATRGDSQRTVGMVVGGVGVVGLVVGGIFGVVSISKKAEADSFCDPPDYRICRPEGKAASDDGMTMGNVSTIAFIAGGALAVGGAVIYFTAPDANTSSNTSSKRVGLTPRFGAHGAGLSLGGAF